MKKQKILHIQVLPKLSGVQKISLEIFKNLPDSHFEKWILFSDSTEKGDKDRCIKEFQAQNVNVLLSPNLKRSIGLKDFSAFIEIYKLCKKEKFDIVHTHSTKPGFIGRIAAYISRTPLVVHTVHGLSFHKFVKFPIWQFYWFCEMFSSIFCDKIFLVNKYYSKYFKFFKSKTSTIYNGIDFSILPKIEKENSIESTCCKILYVGRLDTQKDPLTLLKALKIVATKEKDVSVTIVGDGEKYEECKDFILANNLSGVINMVGWQSDTSKFYASHDLFVMSSIYESFGLIFLEAGYYNLPIVATNVEGIPEVVENGVTGLLSNPLDPEKLAENILILKNDPQLRKSMGDAGFHKVTTTFAAKIMADNYLKAYQSKI